MCTVAAHDHHLTHEKIDLSNQANMHTTTRGPNCAVTVLEFRIENCDLFFQDITNF